MGRICYTYHTFSCSCLCAGKRLASEIAAAKEELDAVRAVAKHLADFRAEMEKDAAAQRDALIKVNLSQTLSHTLVARGYCLIMWVNVYRCMCMLVCLAPVRLWGEKRRRRRTLQHRKMASQRYGSNWVGLVCRV